MLLHNLFSLKADGELKIDTYFSDLFSFLKSHLGSEIMAWVTLSIIGVLAFSLFVYTIIAFINPSKRKLNKLKRTLKRQQEYDLTRDRIFQISEEISTLNLEIRITKKQLEDDIFNLNELERSALEQDNLFIDNKKHQIEDLAENQAILLQVLEQTQKGLLKTMKKDKIDSAKLLICELISQQRSYHNDIYWKTIDMEKRKAQLDLDVKNLTLNCESKVKELTSKINHLSSTKKHLKLKLAMMNRSGRHKLTIADAKAMIDEYTRNKKQTDKENEDIAIENLKKAKIAYESAKDRRILAEKNKTLAVENVRTLQKERAKSKNTKSVKYTPVTEASFTSGDKPDDVNIIIADISNDAVFTPVIAEETIIKDTQEHVYEEPTIEVLDMETLPEEDVVFVEAFLDYLNIDNDDYIEEVASTNDEDIRADAENSPTNNDVEESNTNKETTTSEPIDVITETSCSPEIEISSHDVQPEIVITNTQPEITNYRDNDETPSTPKTVEPITETQTQQTVKVVKHHKPITRLVKKFKPTENKIESPKSNIPAESKYSGKWKIEELDGKYHATLFASNGGKLLTTPSYTSTKGVKSCIDNVKTYLLNDSVAIITDKDGKHFYKVLSPSKRTILQSAKYSTKYQCEKALDSAKRFIQTAIIL
ncbi:MAG: DUF1508 domain-containing protein [Clostridia bacterium]|nr:DUF1508 domain-containing protein [Clostridia bacterium]